MAKQPPPHADEPQPRKVYVALAALKSPPLTEAARIDAGYYLNRLEEHATLTLPISRPMPSIGPRVHELRLSDEAGDWRIIYRNDPDAVVVVDSFKKTTERTPKTVIERCKNRLARYDETE